jgi:restriction system protein
MARRRNEGLFDLLVGLPWWVSVIVTGLVYFALKYWPIGFLANNMFLSAIAKGLQPNAGLFASLFLIPALVSFAGYRKRRKLLDQQSGLDSIRAMSWQRFEMLCGETCLVQCKRWKTVKVSVKEIRELYGIVAAERVDRGICITSGIYTAEAMAFAEGKPLDLIDGPALHNLVREVQKDRLAEPSPLPVRVVTAPSSPVCPRCGGSMVRRIAKRGSNAGGRFWGCSNFPKCSGVLESV